MAIGAIVSGIVRAYVGYKTGREVFHGLGRNSPREIIEDAQAASDIIEAASAWIRAAERSQTGRLRERVESILSERFSLVDIVKEAEHVGGE